MLDIYILDFISLIMILGLGLLGFHRGFVREIVETVGAVLAIILTYNYYSNIESWYGLSENSAWWSKALLFLGVFIAIMVIFTICGRLLRKFLRAINLGMYDRLLGFVLGGVKAAILISILGLLVLWIYPNGDAKIRKTKLMKADLIVFDIFTGNLPETIKHKYAGILSNDLEKLKGAEILNEVYPMGYHLLREYFDDDKIDSIGAEFNNFEKFGISPFYYKGCIMKYDKDHSEGLIEYNISDSTITLPFYYGSFQNSIDLRNNITEDMQVYFDLAYSYLLNKVIAVNICEFASSDSL